MDNRKVIKALELLGDAAEDKHVTLNGVSEAIDMFEECSTFEECKEWIKENI